ncbi:MAG: hypothetical protein JXA71_16180 [Chitinispirillaceae bacterium]|nr:hypothetical protein [Chitinispirillaceae bacterium]
MHNNYYKFLFTLPVARTFDKIIFSPYLALTFPFGLAIVVFIMLSMAAATNNDLLPDGLYSYDEADYIHAADKGFTANYLDKGSIPMGTFVAKGLNAGFNRDKWGQLSTFIRQSDDITFYRHYHGPLYFYWLQAMKSLGFVTEKQRRYSSFLLLLLFSFLCIALMRALLPQQSLPILLLFVLLLLLGPSLLLTFNHITPHSLYTVLSFGCLACAAVFARSGSTRYWYASVVFASLAFMTMEYAVLLLITLVITVWVFRKRVLYTLPRKERRRFVLFSLACFVLPLLLLWPGSVGNLTIVKNYLFFAYFILIRGDTYSPFSPLQVWLLRLRESPVEYGMVLCSLAALPFVIKKNAWLLPLGLYAVMLIAGSIRNCSTYPQYIASLFPVAYAGAAAGLTLLGNGRENRYTLLLHLPVVASIMINAAVFFQTHAPVSWQRMPYQITSLASLRPLLSGATMPVFISRDYVPVLHYYFPAARINAFDLRQEDRARVSGRIAGTLRDRGGSALVFFDGRDLSGRDIHAPLVIERSTELSLSEQAPRAVCYEVSLSPSSASGPLPQQ